MIFFHRMSTNFKIRFVLGEAQQRSVANINWMMWWAVFIVSLT